MHALYTVVIVFFIKVNFCTCAFVSVKFGLFMSDEDVIGAQQMMGTEKFGFKEFVTWYDVSNARMVSTFSVGCGCL